MNKKGLETTILSFIGSLIITAFIVIALLGVIYIILPQTETEEEPTFIFYYKNLVKEIKEFSSNDAKNLPVIAYHLKSVNKNGSGPKAAVNVKIGVDIEHGLKLAKAWRLGAIECHSEVGEDDFHVWMAVEHAAELVAKAV